MCSQDTGVLYRLLLCTALLVLHVSGHGRLIEPPSRASMWRYGYKTPPNYADNQQFCGGFGNQWNTHAGKCGVCGDPWQGPHPHEAGGTFATGTIVRRYESGSVISTVVQLTAAHQGYFEFRICPVNNPKIKATWDCLNKHVLPLADGSGARYYVTVPGARNHEVRLQLPAGVECSQCVLQWKYNAGNSWGVSSDGKGCRGCGPQEQFYACADVAIGSMTEFIPYVPPVIENITDTDNSTILSVSNVSIASNSSKKDDLQVLSSDWKSAVQGDDFINFSALRENTNNDDVINFDTSQESVTLDDELSSLGAHDPNTEYFVPLDTGQRSQFIGTDPNLYNSNPQLYNYYGHPPPNGGAYDFYYDQQEPPYGSAYNNDYTNLLNAIWDIFANNNNRQRAVHNAVRKTINLPTPLPQNDVSFSSKDQQTSRSTPLPGHGVTTQHDSRRPKGFGASSTQNNVSIPVISHSENTTTQSLHNKSVSSPYSEYKLRAEQTSLKPSNMSFITQTNISSGISAPMTDSYSRLGTSHESKSGGISSDEFESIDAKVSKTLTNVSETDHVISKTPCADIKRQSSKLQYRSSRKTRLKGTLIDHDCKSTAAETKKKIKPKYSLLYMLKLAASLQTTTVGPDI